MCVSWFVKEGADRNAHRAGNPHEARGARVDVGMLDPGHGLVMEAGPVTDGFQRQPELLAQFLDALHAL
jgi:hypothetical protein